MSCFNNSIPVRFKAPEAVLTYAVDWSKWLGEGEQISESNWDIPEGITAGPTDKTLIEATIQLSDGVLGSSYRITNIITSSFGETGVQSFDLQIIDQ